MSYTALRQTADKVATLTPFQGNNLRGELFGNIYSVYSYATLMATYNVATGEKWENPQRYSVTTSKQMGYVRQGLANL
jgi:hypothetical protein